MRRPGDGDKRGEIRESLLSTGDFLEGVDSVLMHLSMYCPTYTHAGTYWGGVGIYLYDQVITQHLRQIVEVNPYVYPIHIYRDLPN